MGGFKKMLKIQIFLMVAFMSMGCAKHSYQFHVVDAVTRKPLENVWVAALPDQFAYMDLSSASADVQPWNTTDDGLAHVVISGKRNYNISFQKKGYLETYVHLDSRFPTELRVIAPFTSQFDKLRLSTDGYTVHSDQIVDVPMFFNQNLPATNAAH
ncbi:MAG TPA: hypothetical protein VHD56_01135 [Tepidisphaeraceae bacterium]|nr:hypothetical protein [Tepidisphaeraceae bacterium]